jgi:hypothetical protein
LLKGLNNRQQILVGLRDGQIMAYDWVPSFDQESSRVMPGAGMTLPRIFDVGLLPVNFVCSGSGIPSSALILSDKLWQANLDRVLEIQSVLFDGEVRD